MRLETETSSPTSTTSAKAAPAPRAWPKRLKFFALFAGLLCLAFVKPLFGLARLSLGSALYSHVPLIPLISGYLIWLKRKDPLPAPSGSPALAVIPLATGLVALHELLLGGASHAAERSNDPLALGVFSFLCLLWAGALLFLGARFLRPFAFPVAFLIFIVPMPSFLEHALEVFFQHTSAEAAALLFWLSGSTVFRDGLMFHLPGIVLQVAEECSGIRSSLVLFITSLVAGQMLLQSRWKRAALALFVIPLGIVRNGFRVFTIALLCVHVSPSMIDSPLHRRGGPLFFVLSLIPFFLVLLWLRRLDRRRTPSAPEARGGTQTQEGSGPRGELSAL